MAKNKYESHVLPYLDRISQWASQGCTDKAIAKNLRVSYASYRRYKDSAARGDSRYAEFSKALSVGKAVPDDEVENCLFRRCTGYTAVVAKNFKLKETEYDPNTGKKVSESEKLEVGYDEVHVPANISAQIFWLTNRAPERWRRDPLKDSSVDDGEAGGVILLPPVDGEGTSEEA